jgi:hypothetical protein
MRRQLERPSAGVADRAAALWRSGGPWLGWAAAASIGAVMLAGSLTPRPAPALYHALSAPAPAHGGPEVLVIFRPQASASAIADAVRDSGGRLTDGPTSTGAFVVSVPSGEREKALVTLRARGAVQLAEPIEPGGSQ